MLGNRYGTNMMVAAVYALLAGTLLALWPIQAQGQEPAAEHAALSWIKRAAAETPKIEDREERAEVMALAAGAAAEAGDMDLYRQMVQSALAHAVLTDEFTVGLTMLSIAESQARAGEMEAAMNTARVAGLPVYTTLAYSAVARARAERGDDAGAQRAIALARRELAGLNDPDDHDWAVFFVSEALAAGRDYPAARTVALSSKEAAARAEALGNVAAWQARQGDRDGAAETLPHVDAALAEARRQAQVQEVDAWLDYALSSRASALAALGRFDEAVALINTIEDHSARAMALCDYARALAQDGDRPAALNQLQAAHTRLQEYPEAWERALDLMLVAQVRAEIGQIEGLAAWIDALPTPIERVYANLGAADGLLIQHRQPRPEPEAQGPRDQGE